MNADERDSVLILFALALLVVAAVLGLTHLSRADDPVPRDPVPSFSPVPAYQHPPEYRP